MGKDTLMSSSRDYQTNERAYGVLEKTILCLENRVIIICQKKKNNDGRII